MLSEEEVKELRQNAEPGPLGPLNAGGHEDIKLQNTNFMFSNRRTIECRD